MSNLPIEQIEENFADLYPAMTDSEAAIEANRCLFCFDAPCMHACPTHIDIPGFIKKIANENLTASESAVRDADMASEITNLTRFQILRESGMSVLAQANQSPQSVLNLLRGG